MVEILAEMRRVWKDLEFSFQNLLNFLGDLAGGKCDGMKRAVCPLGGRNEEGMEGCRIVVS